MATGVGSVDMTFPAHRRDLGRHVGQHRVGVGGVALPESLDHGPVPRILCWSRANCSGLMIAATVFPFFCTTTGSFV